ncbi:lecithin retinol acyltransferase family protein [Terrisporobacter sp.]
MKRIRAKGLNRSLLDGAEALYLLYQIKNKVKFKIYSPEETVKRARSKVGEKKFFLPGNNCEHFVLWCKTGVKQSYQVNLLLKAIFVRVSVSRS